MNGRHYRLATYVLALAVLAIVWLGPASTVIVLGTLALLRHLTQPGRTTPNRPHVQEPADDPQAETLIIDHRTPSS